VSAPASHELKLPVERRRELEIVSEASESNALLKFEQVVLCLGLVLYVRSVFFASGFASLNARSLCFASQCGTFTREVKVASSAVSITWDTAGWLGGHVPLGQPSTSAFARLRFHPDPQTWCRPAALGLPSGSAQHQQSRDKRSPEPQRSEPRTARSRAFAYSDMVTSKILRNSLKTKDGVHVYSVRNGGERFACFRPDLAPAARDASLGPELNRVVV
jgi:hypothetical protein